MTQVAGRREGAAEVKKEPNECLCLSGSETVQDEAREGPLYTHLGTAASVKELRKCLELRLGVMEPQALRVEKIVHTGQEGVSKHGCPIAKWIIRRSGEQEKFLALIRERSGHSCQAAVIVVALVSWEAVPLQLADHLYGYLPSQLPKNASPSERRCAANETRTCGCQGLDDKVCGLSYSFGCSWSMFHNACKFARTKENARKFRLKNAEAEVEMGNSLNCLADIVGRVFSNMAPEAFETHTQDSERAVDCRLGLETPLSKRPFSGLTTCLDFCAHPHKDIFMIDGGCSAVVTLNGRKDGLTVNEDEQLHVLPNYIMADTDEFGSDRGQQEKIDSGSIQALKSYPKLTRIRAVPLAPCTSRKKVRKTPATKAPVKEDHSPASIDSGFESIKSNQSPGKDEHPVAVAHQSPPIHFAPPPAPQSLPPIASWFRKSSIDWHPGAVDARQPLPPRPLESRTDFYPPPSDYPTGTFDYDPGSIPYRQQYHPQMRHYQPSPYNGHQAFAYSRQYGDSPAYCGYPGQQWRPQTAYYHSPGQPRMPYRGGYPVHQQYPGYHPHQVPYEQQYPYRPQYQYYRRGHYPPGGIRVQQETPVPPGFAPGAASTPTNGHAAEDSRHSKRPASEASKVADQEFLCDNSQAFEDPQIGGVAIALTHGSVLIEASKHETHATTALKYPNRHNPSSVFIVFYLHKNLCYPKHGFHEYAEKSKPRIRRQNAENKTSEKSEPQDAIQMLHSIEAMQSKKLLKP